MPETATLLTVDIVAATPFSPETSPLFLPHAVPAAIRTSPLAKSLASMEAKLRFAQASDALIELRRSLCVRAHLTDYKHREVRGQRPNTRARALLDKAEAKTGAAAERYRCARRAYFELVGPGEWEQTLKVLNKSDIRSMAEDEDEDEQQSRRSGPHEGYRLVSWIWMAPGVSTDGDSEMHDGI
jgi:hypothetical protein